MAAPPAVAKVAGDEDNVDEDRRQRALLDLR